MRPRHGVWVGTAALGLLATLTWSAGRGERFPVAAAQEPDGKPRNFIGVWQYGDHGDVAPWAVLNATPTTTIIHGHSMALIPEAKELITVSGGHLFVFRIPEIFQ